MKKVNVLEMIKERWYFKRFEKVSRFEILAVFPTMQVHTSQAYEKEGNRIISYLIRNGYIERRRRGIYEILKD